MNQNKILEVFSRSTKGIKCPREAQAAFIQGMTQNNVRLLGKGWYSTVWGIGSQIYKINSGFQGERDGFLRWALATRDYIASNPHMPWVGDIAVHEHRYCIELERLQPLGIDQIRMLGAEAVEDLNHTHLARYARQTPKLAEALELAHDLSKVAWPDQDYEPDATLQTKIGELDFCEGTFFNLMHRNGVIVINDPLAHSQDKIGPYAQELARGLMQWAA